VISAWYKHLKTEAEQADFKNQLLGSKVVFRRMQTLLDEEKIEPEANDYNLPNWELRQADMIGYNRCLKKISKLINLDQEAK
jgi:hypothetical protein